MLTVAPGEVRITALGPWIVTLPFGEPLGTLLTASLRSTRQLADLIIGALVETIVV